MELEYIVKKDEDDIKRILIEELKISKYQIKRIDEKDILVNNKNQRTYQKVHKGDLITINLNYYEDNSNIVPNPDIKFEILYEDDWMLIVNKPKFIPVHPTMGHYEDSLSNGIKYYYDKIGLNKKIRPVNRLDRNTTGIVIFAKSEYIQNNLTKYNKEYLAIVEGKLEGSGIINKGISRKKGSIIERCIDNNGKEAITYYETIKNYEKIIRNKEIINYKKTFYNEAETNQKNANNNDIIENINEIVNSQEERKINLQEKRKINLQEERNINSQEKRNINLQEEKNITSQEEKDCKKVEYTLVKCILETGRTHQIRVHLASINHPILGDSLYGKESNLIDRQALHAYKISFVHPVTNERIEITADLPDDMKGLLIT